VLVLLLVCAAFLGRAQGSAVTEGRTPAVSAWIQGAIFPLAKAFGRVATGTGDFFGGALHARELREQNQQLRQQAAVAALYEERLEALAAEVASLRKLAGFDIPERIKIPVEIIGFAMQENRITLSAGTASGVRSGLPVVAPDGLLAVVQTVDAHTSQAILITSPPPFRIGAMVSTDPPVAGLMHGEGPDRLVVEFLDLVVPVQPGDLVFTSGFSEKIPRGIPVGRVVQVHVDAAFGVRRAHVFPNAHVGSSREVFILR
jgi:rod shape-determining protein MreC